MEHGHLFFIQAENGLSVTFETREDFERCTGLDFSNKFHISYEPDIEYFYDSENPEISSADIPAEPYETLIANVPTLRTRKNNPLYGLSGQAYLKKQAELAKQAELENRKEEFKQANTQDGIRTVTIEQLDNYLDSKYDPTEFQTALQALQNASNAGEMKSATIDAIIAIRDILLSSKSVDRRIALALLEVIVSTE